jgi:hypothetical protein
MESKKYEKIRNRVKKMNFEGKYKQLSNWLFGFSFFGNIGSIFFSYFLLYPIFFNALNKYINNNLSLISSIFTVLVMFMFEIVKRIVVKNFSFDLVKSKYSFKKLSVVYLFISSFTLISLSFYFSVNGAINFTDNDRIIRNELNNELTINKDSVREKYEIDKLYFINENKRLREQNSELRDKIIETPLNYRTTRKEYQDIIDSNNKIIENNENKINNLNQDLENEFILLQKNIDEKIGENNDENSTSIIVFILISSFIEFIIILGIYFNVYYELTVYKLNEGILEKYFKKRDNYLILLGLLYKNGNLNPGDLVIGLNRFKELLKENNVPDSNKLVVSFFSDLEYNNIVKTQGKRKYFVVDYETAKEIIVKMGENIDIFNKLK